MACHGVASPASPRSKSVEDSGHGGLLPVEDGIYGALTSHLPQGRLHLCPPWIGIHPRQEALRRPTQLASRLRHRVFAGTRDDERQRRFGLFNFIRHGSERSR